MTKKMVAFTAPSGAGKSTIVRHLLKNYDDLAFSISATTRDARAHETDGIHYYFISEGEFQDKLKAGEFVEYEEVYEGLFYGTLKSEIDRLIELNKVVVFDIDVLGAENIKKTYGDDCLTVFVKPPSFETLVTRLKNRNTENEANLKKRIERIAGELKYEKKFDLVLINDDLSIALEEAEQLVEHYFNVSKNGKDNDQRHYS